MNPKLSVGRSLQILAAMVLAGLAVSLWVFMDYAGSATKAMDRMVNSEGGSAFLLQEMWAQGLQTEQALRNLIFNPGDEKAAANYQEADQAFAKAHESLMAKDLPIKDDLANILGKWRELRAMKDEVRRLARGGQPDQAVALLNARETPLWREVKALILSLSEGRKKQLKASFDEQQANQARDKAMVLGATAVFSLLTLTVLYLVSRRIKAPLSAMGEFSRKIAEGDFTARLEGGYALEFEKLKKSLVTMTQELKESLGFSSSVMHGFRQPFLTVDHEARITFINQPALDMLDVAGRPEQFIGQPAGAYFYNDPNRPTNIARLIKSGDWSSSNDITLTGRKGRVVRLRADRCQLRDLEGHTIGGISTYMDLTAIKESERLALARAEDIRHAAHETGNIASGLFQSTESLSGQINQVARGSAEQRDRTQQASQSMEDLNESVAMVAKSAEQALSEAAATEEKALAGSQVVKRSMLAIQTAAENAKELGVNMERLGQQSQSIGRVLEVISDIADQTNLLALNAAIEAARAGEAGRGFAVVADEVRKLAEKTMAATKEVGDKIQAVQDSAKSSLEGMREATETIGQATRLAGESETALREIVALAQTNAASGKNIVEAAREQSRVVGEIAKASEEVRRIADQTDEGMSTAALALEQLTQMAGALKDLVGRLSA